MQNRRIALLAAALTFLSTVVSASTLITWDFSGTLTGTTVRFGLDELYPVGTPFSLNITFDPEAPRIPRPPGPYGLYNAITAATLQLGNTTTTSSGGYIAVNCHAFPQGCPIAGPNPWVEFLMFPNPVLSPPLNPSAPASGVARILVDYRDPNVMTGNIPTMPPAGPGGIYISAGNPQFPFATLPGRFESVRPIEDVVAPEPGTFLLLAAGLAGLRARRRRNSRESEQAQRFR